MFLKNLYNKIVDPKYGSYRFWGVMGIMFLAGLGAYPLLDNNEGLYAQIPWEMLGRKDFIIPYLKGVPYIEKPPLLYWLISLSYSLFGKNEWAARLIPALGGLSTCLALWFMGRRLGKSEWGRTSALITATSLGFAVFSRMVFFDALLTAFFTWAIIYFYLYTQLKDKKYLRGMYVFLGFALLAKGFLSLALAGLVIFIFQTHTFKSLKWIPLFLDMKGILIFLVITLPWHVAASFSHEGFAYFYFINEHILRFLDLRLPRDYYRGPWWYYLPRLAGYMVPWTFLVPVAFRVKTPLPLSLKNFLWLWFLIPLLFFSLSRAKANYYMVIGLPPLACILGWYLQEYNNLIRGVIIFSMVVILSAVTLFPRYIDQWSQAKTATFMEQLPGPLYIYKRYEEVSSLFYYSHKPVPIIDSESNDLAYGESTHINPATFITGDQIEIPCFILVLDRDKEEFYDTYMKNTGAHGQPVFKNFKTSIIKVTS